MRVTLQSSESSHTVDCILFGYDDRGLVVLLVKRNVSPFAGEWVLPGGAVGEMETLENSANRVLREMVGIERGYLKQVATYSDPDRHPDRRVITTSYYCLVRPEAHAPVARQHIGDARWVPLREITRLGFDHMRLLRDAYRKLADDLETQNVGFRLLPERFTLTDVQVLYESVLDEPLDRANFRRKLLSYDFLVSTGEKKSGVRGGPALYRVDKRKFLSADHRTERGRARGQ